MNEAEQRFFEEVTRQLRKHGFEPLPLEDGRLLIQRHGTALCQVASHGGLRYAPDETTTQHTEELRNQIHGIVRITAEYMTQMETAPQLKASSLEGDYRLLAEFNNIVLAGHKTRFGIEFITWEWVQNHTALWQGHYTESYTAAKEDFATRSGLVPREKLFSDRQMAEVYRCIHETLENKYPLTDERKKLLCCTAEQIQSAVPKLDRLVQQSNEKELIQGQADGPGMTQQF